jgi:hypothetical protein
MMERTFSARLGCRYLLDAPERRSADRAGGRPPRLQPECRGHARSHPPDGGPAPRPSPPSRGRTASSWVWGGPGRVRLDHQPPPRRIHPPAPRDGAPRSGRSGRNWPSPPSGACCSVSPSPCRSTIALPRRTRIPSAAWPPSAARCPAIGTTPAPPHRPAVLHIARSHDEFYPAERTEQYARRLRLRCDDVEFQLLPGGHRFPSRAGPIWETG